MLASFPRKTSGNMTVIGSAASLPDLKGPLAEAPYRQALGGKAWNLLRVNNHLQEQELKLAKIPRTFALSTDVVSAIASDPLTEGAMILSGLGFNADSAGFKAIRSSSVCEDHATRRGVGCPGIFKTHFLFYDGGNVTLAQRVADVASSALSPHACAYLDKNGLHGNMAVMIQSLVGGHLPSGYFGPLFSGVLDTSSVNGEGTMTFSFVLGLGAEGAGTMHNSNILITQKGNCSPSKVQPYLRQREGAMFNSKTHSVETLDIERLLSGFNLASVAGATDLFMRKYLGPLYNLSCSLSKLFGYEYADMEFAVSPLKGRKLYVLQIRESMMRADLNKEYPVGIKDEDTIAKSRSVLGTITVKANALISMSSAQYLEEAENGFGELIKFDADAGAQGRKFMLLVPPEATSSESEQLHPSLFDNLVFIVEKPVNGDVHRLGVSGVDHMSRLLSETNIGYMEAFVNPNLLHVLPHTTHPTFTVYDGNFGAAVCSATKRGILYLLP